MPPHPASAEEEHQVSIFQDEFSTVTANSPQPSREPPAGKQRERGGDSQRRGRTFLRPFVTWLENLVGGESGMELGTETSLTRSTGHLVFKNPNCKTCYQIIENSIFIYLVLPKKRANPATFPRFPED